MLDRVVVILGPFRSGTSLVAAVVHRLGFQVAPFIMAPAPPAWRSDFEDPLFTGPLMESLVPSKGWFRSYLTARREKSAALGFDGRIAIKSAYLACHWGTFLEALGAKPFVIRTYRYEVDRQRSLQAHPALSLADDAALVKAINAIQPDAEIGYEWACENPLRLAEILASHLGQTDDRAVAAAAALVGTPTEYQQHGLPDRIGSAARQG